MATQEQLFSILENNIKAASGELEGARGHRAIVLVNFALVDQAVYHTLTSFLAECSDTDNLLNSERGALGPFVPRVRLCVALGLIPPTYGDAARELAKIRNEFAHKLDAAFGQKAVACLQKVEAIMRRPPATSWDFGQRYGAVASELAIYIGLLWSEERLASQCRVHPGMW